MPFYESDGLKLHYLDLGEGEPLILLHGFGQDSTAWVDVQDNFAQHFRTLVLDMRGSGQSDVPEPGYTPLDIAGDVIGLIDHLGYERVHFGGWSLGGATGIELAIAHPERLASLSLHSTWEGGDCPHMRRWIDVRTRIISQNDPVVNLGTRIVSFFSPEFVNANEDLVEAYIERSLANPHPITPKGVQGHAEACLKYDAIGRLDQVKTPTLITVGSMDRSTLPSQSRYLHEHIEGSELIYIDGAGHFTPFQAAREFTTIGLGFLMKHRMEH